MKFDGPSVGSNSDYEYFTWWAGYAEGYSVINTSNSTATSGWAQQSSPYAGPGGSCRRLGETPNIRYRWREVSLGTLVLHRFLVRLAWFLVKHGLRGHTVFNRPLPSCGLSERLVRGNDNETLSRKISGHIPSNRLLLG